MPPLFAFTGPQVERFTGLSRSTLRYWEETDVFRATFVDDRPRRAYRRIYTFRDLVSLRTLATLRRDHRVSLEELRQVGRHLSKHADAPWAELQFRVSGHHVAFRDPETKEWVSGKPFGQQFIVLDMDEVRRTTEEDAKRLTKRDPNDIGQISRHRYVQHNAWVIAGTRITTSAIWHFHQAGYDTDAIIAEYPRLTPEDVKVAIAKERELRGLVAA